MLPWSSTTCIYMMFSNTTLTTCVWCAVDLILWNKWQEYHLSRGLLLSAASRRRSTLEISRNISRRASTTVVRDHPSRCIVSSTVCLLLSLWLTLITVFSWHIDPTSLLLYAILKYFWKSQTTPPSIRILICLCLHKWITAPFSPIFCHVCISHDCLYDCMIIWLYDYMIV